MVIWPGIWGYVRIWTSWRHDCIKYLQNKPSSLTRTMPPSFPLVAWPAIEWTEKLHLVESVTWRELYGNPAFGGSVLRYKILQDISKIGKTKNCLVWTYKLLLSYLTNVPCYKEGCQLSRIALLIRVCKCQHYSDE